MCLFSSFSAINDCLTSPADCVAIANCIDTGDKLGFFCHCPQGYTGDGRKSGSGCAGEALINKWVNTYCMYFLSFSKSEHASLTHSEL